MKTFSETLEEYLDARDALKRIEDGPRWSDMRMYRAVERKQKAAADLDRQFKLLPKPIL